MIIILFTLFVIIVVGILGIEEDLDYYEEFDQKKGKDEKLRGFFGSGTFIEFSEILKVGWYKFIQLAPLNSC